ncbi:uncharacterized protein LOC129585678 [Paramacrobiotus metropolitanus]|uniref:uncharacterized protein LOC129585678 n=1 Tax=Paramacrobiotus metropolitanus TaxID=2943436 RepID=UPI002445E393|nr:uncharacterized protein LOC129585678 [Paramacrobiotus metropolitanus]XP_055334433.1 uncharacterized protein LOC129585678 [Paramacrobiotus metropolitanus]
MRTKSSGSLTISSFVGIIGFLLCLDNVHGLTENSDIVLDESRPQVFYCPTKAWSEKEKKILTALPIERLCQYGPGGKRPLNSAGDCYNDVDETPIACDEKARFLKRLKVRQETENLVNTKDF